MFLWCFEMSKDLEAIKKKRKFLRKSVTDTLKLIDEALSQQDNNARVQVLKDNVASKWSDLQEVQATMCTMLEDAEIEAECESHNDYEMRVIESMAKMTNYLASKHVPEAKLAGSNPPVSQSPSQVQVKLPKINLPTFDGNVLSWQPYYQSIKVSVVDNPSLADVQKLEYLMRSLKGSAAEAVKGFAVVQGNYKPVLETLKERFGHTRLILDAHVRSLIHLPRLSSDDATSMRKFYDEVIGHVRSVESMGEKFNSETLAPVLVPLIVDKLPKEVVEKWELELNEEKAKQDCVEVKILFTFLEQLIRAKESSQPPSLNSKVPAKENFGNRENRFKFNRSQKSSTSALCATTHEGKCVVCYKNHGLKSCVSFLSLPVNERFRKAASKGLCFRCLEPGHRAEMCQKPPCKHCQGRHHSLLHHDSARPHLEDVKVESAPELPSSSSSPPVSSSVVANSVAVSSGGKVILQTVPAILSGSNGCSKVVRCFFDPGSQTSFVRQSVIDELGLDGKNVKIAVSGFGGGASKSSLRKRIVFTVAPVDKSGQPQCIEALTTPVICRPAEAVEIHPRRWSHLQNIVFPEEFPREEQEIEVLIGLDFYYSFVTRDIVKGGSNEPVAVRTTLGWVFCGPTGGHDQECSVSMNVQIGAEEQLNETLQKFWDLESIGIRPAESSISTTHAEDVTLKKFKETLTYNDGRYEVCLPWKEDRVALKDNYRQAERRLYNLEKKLLHEPMKAASYGEAINKYAENGVAEEVPCDEIIPTDGRPVFYLPHHAIIREDKQTTKTRVVFDASARDSNGVSLNSCLEPGPALQPDLVGILLRFRKNYVGIMGDIEKMFLQIRLKEEDRDSHRYLWRDLDPKATPKIYRMTRVTFGVVSSPFLAIGTIQEHVRRCKETFPVASSEILRNTYVDDFASGRDNVQETLKLQQSAAELMQKAAFNLTKWSSNSSEVMDAIPERDRAAVSLVNLESGLAEAHPITKALGLKWNTITDNLVFGINVDVVKSKSKTVYTKREVASLAAKLFDPIGLIAPFLVRSKLILQSLWTKGVGWDEEIPMEVSLKWNQWIQELSELEHLHIPRCYTDLPLGQNPKVELHAFGDASEVAYASAIYLRVVREDGRASTSLVMSKTRVAPVRKITLPRLELMAAVITARLCTYVKGAIDCAISRIVCWTDNSSTLHWIRGAASQWKPFVANRVIEIQSLLDPSVWRYCPGPQNPADLPTRGVSASQLRESHLWWKGPSWLQESEKDWPKDLRSKPSSEIVDPERKSKVCVSCVVQPKEPFIDFIRFSKYSRLIRTVAWIRRFVSNSRVKEERRIDSSLTGLEIRNGEEWLISQVQAASFPEEIASSKQHGVVKDSNLANLNPFMCPTSHFLRVGGRIHKSLLPEEEKHPIILPSNHPVVKLLIEDVHRRELHAGVEHTLSVLRQKFWLIKGRSTVRQTLRNCLICRHYQTKPFGQQMAPLPEDRIKPAPPFTNVGLDFAGPLYLKDSDEKVYICLFTCAVTRAVHLELVCDMTTERFLLALRRMIARRGMCSIIWSDNAKTFKAANKELQRCWRVLESDQIQSALSEKKIQWKFIVERAPWWGGFYERLVKSVKTPLKKLFAKAMLDAEQLTTILAEIEAQLNSRPLTYLGADPDDYSVITPAQILIGRNLQACPTKDTRVSEQTSRALTKRFQYHRKLVNGFWKRWHAEYLKSLTPLKRWYKIGREIRKGDLVLVSEDRVARGQWSRARVEDAHTGRDGLVRSVTLRTSSGSLTRRPVQRLHLFEACDADLAAELT